MSIFVTSNLPAFKTQVNLAKSQAGLGRTLSRLSSGLRINAAGDDAAGLAVANRNRMDNVSLLTRPASKRETLN